MASNECINLYGQAGSANTYVASMGLTHRKEVLLNEDELEAKYEAVTAPIISENFGRAFAPSRYGCHVSALGPSIITDSAKQRVAADIATLKAVRANLQEKLRVLPHYARSQGAELAELRAKAEFAGAASHVDMTDPVSRATTGFLQWPLTESMTASMASLAVGFGVVAFAIAGIGMSPSATASIPKLPGW